jgi:hypothetical protein
VCLNYTTPTILDIAGIYFKTKQPKAARNRLLFLFFVFFSNERLHYLVYREIIYVY